MVKRSWENVQILLGEYFLAFKIAACSTLIFITFRSVCDRYRNNEVIHGKFFFGTTINPYPANMENMMSS